MSYVTKDAMLKKFGERELRELTDNEAPYLDAINDDKLNAAMQAANSEIDSYLIGRYASQLPFPSVPHFLQSLACEMARYHAATGAMSDNDPIQTRYKAALATLDKLAKGQISLGGNPAGESAPLPTSNNNVMWSVGRRDFGGGGW